MSTDKMILRPKLTLLLQRLLAPMLTGSVALVCSFFVAGAAWAAPQATEAWIFVFVQTGFGVMSFLALGITLFLIYEALSWFMRTWLVVHDKGVDFSVGGDGFSANWASLSRIERASNRASGGELLHFTQVRWSQRIERVRRTAIGRLFDSGDAVIPLSWFQPWSDGRLGSIIEVHLKATDNAEGGSG